MQISHDNIIWMFREYYIFVTVFLTARQNGVFSAKYPKAEVSARNIAMTSDELRKKLKAQSGGNVHIFGIGIDFGDRKSSNWLVAAVRRQTV